MPALQRGMCVAAVLVAAAMATQCQQVKHTHDQTREQIVQGLMKLSDEELHRRDQRLRKEHTKAVLDRNQTQEQSLQELIQLGEEEQARRWARFQQESKELERRSARLHREGEELDRRAVHELRHIVVAEIKSGCQSRVGSYGAALVKACVDQDIAAYNALQSYPSKHQRIIDRCDHAMVATGGWSLVKASVDQDIAAATAPENY